MVKNRNVTVRLVRPSDNPGEWIVQRFVDLPGIWRPKKRTMETTMTEAALLAMGADADVRAMVGGSGRTIVRKNPKRTPLNEITRAQFRLADHRAKLMRASN